MRIRYPLVALVFFLAGLSVRDVVRDAWAGKGEIDARALVDYDATNGAVPMLLFLEFETCSTNEWTDLVDASTGQSAFDTEATTVFGSWYSGKPASYKTAAYKAFEAIRLAQ